MIGLPDKDMGAAVDIADYNDDSDSDLDSSSSSSLGTDYDRVQSAPVTGLAPRQRIRASRPVKSCRPILVS